MSKLVFNPSHETRVSALSLKPWHRVLPEKVDPELYRKYLGWRPLKVVKKTLEHTTQYAKHSIRHPLQRHFKARNPFANVHRLNEAVSTDTIFANCASIFHRFSGLQVYWGLKSHKIDVYGIKSKGDFPATYRDFIREQGAPSILRRDNAREEASEEVTELNRTHIVKDQFSEPYNQQQNPVELHAIRWLKQATHVLLDRTNAPDAAWYLAAKYLSDVHEVCYDAKIGMTPLQFRTGVTPDISAFLQHAFWDPVLYYDHEESWPSSKERSRRWVGVSKNVGDCLTYWVLDDQTKRVLARSVVRPYYNNKRTKWDPAFNNAPTKSTAHHAGDKMPPKATRDRLLRESMDEYDDSRNSRSLVALGGILSPAWYAVDFVGALLNAGSHFVRLLL